MNQFGRIMASEIAETPEVFASLLENSSVFNEVKDVLDTEKIHSVLILARGTSDNAAHFLKYLIETQIGLPVGLTSPSSVTIYGSNLQYANTLIVAISQSGQSPDLVKFATAARSSMAYIIAMTNDDKSPLASIAHHHISLLAGPELSVAATKSYNAQLLVSYLLVMAWAGKKVNSEQIIKQASKLVANNGLVTNAVSQVTRDKEIVILGRALTEQTQVFIVAPTGLPTQSITEATSKIRTISSRIFWIGNGGVPTGNDIVIAGSDCDDEITSSLVDAIALQRFALEFAVASGFDPDAPVGLSKVTLTN
jgi:glucosamine--fructose-6-phosphate aminotransferase (isomerizing)